VRYLKIENRVREIPSFELLGTLGASASRGIDSRRGQFGTGTLNGIAACAREGLIDGLRFCMGKNVFTFGMDEVRANDSNGNIITLYKIYAKQQNGPKFPLNIDLSFGIMDHWNLDMALREFVTNAVDGADSYDGTTSTVDLDIIDTSNNERTKFAKDPFIRIYIPVTNEALQYYKDIRRHFICLRSDYDPARSLIDNYDDAGAHFYRKGVLIGDFGERSLFHYNSRDVKISDSRKIDYDDARKEAAHLIMQGSVDQIARFLKGYSDPDIKYWEKDIDGYYLNPDNYTWRSDEALAQVKRNWNSAIERLYGGKTVVVESDIAETAAREKGYNPVRADYTLAGTLKTVGLPSADTILTSAERSGRNIIDDNFSCDAMRRICAIIDSHKDILNKKNLPFPAVNIYEESAQCETSQESYYEKGVIFIRKDISEGSHEELIMHLLDRLAQHMTGREDYSAALKRWLGRYAACLMRDGARNVLDAPVTPTEYLIDPELDKYSFM